MTTTAERNQAVISNNIQRQLSMKGVLEARRLGFQLQLAILRNPSQFKSASKRVFRLLKPLMIGAMVVSHLAGKLKSRQRAKKYNTGLELSSHSVYDSAIDFHVRRLQISVKELKDVSDAYEAEAVLVLKGASARVERVMQRTLKLIMEKGLHVKDAKTAIRKAFASAGITPANSSTFETIFRTQTLMAYSAGQWEQNQNEAIDEILWGYTYTAVGDDRTRPEHNSLDGTTLPKDHPLWNTIFPPNGWNCRCQVIEIFDTGKSKLPPKSVVVDGKKVIPGPDKGFSFNPGKVFVPAA